MLAMISTTSLRELRIPDAEFLAELHQEAFGAAKAWTAETLRQSLSQPNVCGLLCIAGQQPAGFILVSRAADEAEILTLCVTPAFQRKNLASYLVRAMANDLHKMKIATVFLEVAVTNHAAGALYRTLGFREKSIRKNYYHDADGFTDASVMAAALPLT